MKVSQSLGLTAFLFATCLPAHGGTMYVDTIFGDDTDTILGGGGTGDNTTCKKTTPCQTIQHTIDQGGANTRIILAPGPYIGALTITEEKVSIESVAGAMSTQILGDDESAAAIILVTANKFTLGKKGKGVTVGRDFASMDPTNNQDGVHVTGDQAKIEGNIFQGDDFDFSSDLTGNPVEILGEKPTIRFNEASSWEYGIKVDSDGAASKSIVSDNYITGIGDTCLEITGDLKSSDKVTGNRIDFCSADFDEPRDGMQLIYPPSEVNSKPKVQKNLIQGVRNGISVANAVANISGNLVRWASKDTSALDMDGSAFVLLGNDKSKVTNNFTDGTENTIYFDDMTTDSTVTGNTMIFSFNGPVIDSATTSPIKTFSKNNIDVFECPVVTGGTDYTAGPIEMKQNFWYGYADTAGDNSPFLFGGAQCADADTAKTGGTLTFSKSADKPNPVKFKSPI